nr:MAG TPA: hypothetical protein [Caudoviricetes sp.]
MKPQNVGGNRLFHRLIWLRYYFTSVTFGYYLLTIFLWRIVISGYVSRFINLDYCVRSDCIFILFPSKL